MMKDKPSSRNDCGIDRREFIGRSAKLATVAGVSTVTGLATGTILLPEGAQAAESSLGWLCLVGYSRLYSPHYVYY